MLSIVVIFYCSSVCVKVSRMNGRTPKCGAEHQLHSKHVAGVVFCAEAFYGFKVEMVGLKSETFWEKVIAGKGSMLVYGCQMI